MDGLLLTSHYRSPFKMHNLNHIFMDLLGLLLFHCGSARFWPWSGCAPSQLEGTILQIDPYLVANHPQVLAPRHCCANLHQFPNQTSYNSFGFFPSFIANFVTPALAASPLAVPTCCSAVAIAQQLHSPGRKVSGPWAWPHGEVSEIDRTHRNCMIHDVNGASII